MKLIYFIHRKMELYLAMLNIICPVELTKRILDSKILNKYKNATFHRNNIYVWKAKTAPIPKKYYKFIEELYDEHLEKIENIKNIKKHLQWQEK